MYSNIAGASMGTSSKVTRVIIFWWRGGRGEGGAWTGGRVGFGKSDEL